MFCTHCGKELADTAFMCPNCGAPTRKAQSVPQARPENVSEKDWLTTLLLCLFFGCFGIHNFYSGRTVAGVVQLLTLGCCGIWTLIDFILILCGSYTDGEGKLILNR